MGAVPYPEAVVLQEELVARRRAGEIADTLLLLEHPHVITLGSGGNPAHVLLDEGERKRRRIDLYRASRGGDVTYHGPGQLVAYPILDLKPDRKDLHRYLRDLEEALVRTAAAFGVNAHVRPGLTGVWTGRGKLAAIGVRVSSGWITSHGVALNVSTDASYFGAIIPCGIPDAVAVSLETELGREVTMESVQIAFAEEFAAVFGRRLRWT